MTIRDVQSHAERLACLDLQKATWGGDCEDLMSPAVMVVIRKTGGIMLGAFDGESLLGFVVSFLARVERELVQWSDMMAVRPELRDQGLGLLLKVAQREACLAAGFRKIYWTFDPLESRNAWLNFHKLGVTARRYERDFYGEVGGTLLAGMATDRLVVCWEAGRSAEPWSGQAHTVLDAVHAEDGLVMPGNPRLMHQEGDLRVEIPLDIQALKMRSKRVARKWRGATRAALEHYLVRGWAVVGYERDQTRGGYRLRRAGDSSDPS